MSLNLFRYTIEYDKKSQQQDIDLCSFYVSGLTKDKQKTKFGFNFPQMNNLPDNITPPPKPIFRHILMSFYYLIIGFCAVGIWLKWDAINSSDVLEQYTSHIYEEGFEAVAVTVPFPVANESNNFLRRLAPPADSTGNYTQAGT